MDTYDYLSPRDRFMDEHDESIDHNYCGDCGTCEEFVQCPFQGYEELGWCSHYDEFTFKEEINDCWVGDE